MTGTTANLLIPYPELTDTVASLAATGQASAEVLDTIGAPWTNYTPTLAPSIGGVITSAAATGRYKVIGKTVHVQCRVQVVTVGTATGILRVGLPYPVRTGATSFVLAGRENVTTGNALVAECSGGSSYAQVSTYNNGSSLVNGHVSVFSGTYER